MKRSKARRRASMNSALKRNFSGNKQYLSLKQKFSMREKLTDYVFLWKGGNNYAFVIVCQAIMKPDKISESPYNKRRIPSVLRHIRLHKDII